MLILHGAKMSYNVLLHLLGKCNKCIPQLELTPFFLLPFLQYQSFPLSKNGFKVGMRLEGIDPLHPSMFCVLSVAEVSVLESPPHTHTHTIS